MHISFYVGLSVSARAKKNLALSVVKGADLIKLLEITAPVFEAYSHILAPEILKALK